MASILSAEPCTPTTASSTVGNMRPPAPWHYVLWLLVGALGGLGVLSLLTIGPLLLLATGALTVLCVVLRLLNRSITALPAGLAVPVLYLAWLNRGGPGDVCDANGCTGEWSPWPFVAVAVVTTVSLILLLVFAFSTKRGVLFRIGPRSLVFFLCAASLATLAQVANFIALGHGELSVIIPLVNTTPLFAVLFSAVFLRNIETVNRRIVLGALTMVSGILLITIR